MLLGLLAALSLVLPLLASVIPDPMVPVCEVTAGNYFCCERAVEHSSVEAEMFLRGIVVDPDALDAGITGPVGMGCTQMPSLTGETCVVQDYSPVALCCSNTEANIAWDCAVPQPQERQPLADRGSLTPGPIPSNDDVSALSLEWEPWTAYDVPL